MKTITTYALLGLLALSGATLVGCSGSLDVQPNPNSVPANQSSDVKKQTTYDANGNVVQQKTTETKTTP